MTNTRTSPLQELRRSHDGAWIQGVCAGLGGHTAVPAWLWRVGFVLLAWLGGAGVLLYVLLAVFMPAPREEPTTSPAWRQAGRALGRLRRSARSAHSQKAPDASS